SLGRYMENSLKEQEKLGIKLDKDQLIAGVQDAFADKSKLSDQQTTFAGFFPLLLAYSLTYMPTIALTNSIAFANVPDVERDFP
ncbi:hypothetical protein MJI47_30480, partial [Salmonella enterica subsp. enterica serovar Kentucky]|nr:hypothetical protein [Salmonella enterica subsp. enterica serovar Kentucky]